MKDKKRTFIHSMDLYRTIGGNIRKAREETNIGQTELGRIIGLGHDSIYNIEHAKTRPEYAIIRAIAEVFSLTSDDLAKESLDVSKVKLNVPVRL